MDHPYFTALVRIIRWEIGEIVPSVQVGYTPVVSGFGSDFGYLHQFSAFNEKFGCETTGVPYLKK
jgi:hypothetical protein